MQVNMFLFVVKMYFSLFLFRGLFPLECVFMYVYFCDAVRWEMKPQKISARVHQKKIKTSWKEYVM